MKRNNTITKLLISSKQSLIPNTLENSKKISSINSNGSIIIKGGINVGNPDLLLKKEEDYCQKKLKKIEESLPGTIGFNKFIDEIHSVVKDGLLIDLYLLK